MRIYISSVSLRVCLKLNQLFPDKPLHMLRSFGGLSNDDPALRELFKRKQITSLTLDSGAWTANKAKTQGITITIDSYEAFLHLFKNEYDYYINLDPDFSGKGFGINYENQRHLEEAGFKPVPVIHDYYGSEVEYYADQGYPLIALGSFPNRNLKVIEYAVNKLSKYPCKIHLFGKSNYSDIAHLPLWSCDSSNWAQNNLFGYILYWNNHNVRENKTDSIYFRDFLTRNYKRKYYFHGYPFRNDLETHIYETLAITYDDLMGKESHFYRQVVNAAYYLQLEEIITKIHLKQGF